jgi:uncharacterized 2Fe-2S/4Fe-4S cluster protein (DUF4445 family)
MMACALHLVRSSACKSQATMYASKPSEINLQLASAVQASWMQLDHRGSIRHVHPAVRTDTPRGAFLLAGAAVSGHGRDVLVTRHDVNEIQLAKGAIRAGVEVLLRQAGLPSGPQGYNAINEFIVAGAFGTYISIESAVTVGMFPPLPRERFKQVGNAAGAGARQMLISKKRRSMAQVVVKDIEYIELSSNPLFLGEFSKAIFFNEQE